MNTKKKGFRQKLKWFFAKIRWRELGLFRLTIQRSNLDGGTLNLDGETLTLDGGTRPPYNLSTAFTPWLILCPPQHRSSTNYKTVLSLLPKHDLQYLI